MPHDDLRRELHVSQDFGLELKRCQTTEICERAKMVLDGVAGIESDNVAAAMQ